MALIQGGLSDGVFAVEVISMRVGRFESVESGATKDSCKPPCCVCIYLFEIHGYYF